MIKTNLKMARTSLRNAKWKSILASVGIIVGTASVITIVSLGEGVKRQIIHQINDFGSDLVVIRPGRSEAKGTSLLFSQSRGSFSQQDFQVVSAAEHVGKSAPLSFISSILTAEEVTYDKATIIGTTSDFPSLINQEIGYGTFFGAGDGERHIAVVGADIAERLFKENGPIGSVMKIRGEEFVIRGVLNRTNGNSLALGVDFDNTVFIPYQAAELLTGGGQITEILLKPGSNSSKKQLSDSVRANLTAAHGGQEDFSVLNEPEQIALTGQVVNIFTGLIEGIAAISLIVGGAGIMNIMLVSVTERTREIGIRKAIGATNGQLLGQFLVEAIILTAFGGSLGVIGAFVAVYFISIFSSFSPVISLPSIVIALIAALMIGIIFGMVPAIKAARKDPIEALRYE